MYIVSKNGSPYRRYLHLRSLLREIQTRAKAYLAPFSILCYGSASYGFNPRNHGKFDDLDLFMITPNGIGADEIIASGRQLFPEEFEVNEHHVRHLSRGECDMCRLYCRLDGVKIGFKLMPHDVLMEVSHPSGSSRPVRNVASIGQSRIMIDREWSFSLNTYVPVTYENYNETIEGEKVLTVVQRVFSEGNTHLGALGRKLLTAHRVYNAPNQGMEVGLRNIWQTFVSLSLANHPELSNEQIIASIMRAEKFSRSSRAKFSRIIDACRD